MSDRMSVKSGQTDRKYDKLAKKIMKSFYLARQMNLCESQMIY